MKYNDSFSEPSAQVFSEFPRASELSKCNCLYWPNVLAQELLEEFCRAEDKMGSVRTLRCSSLLQKKK